MPICASPFARWIPSGWTGEGEDVSLVSMRLIPIRDRLKSARGGSVSSHMTADMIHKVDAWSSGPARLWLQG